MGDQSNKKSDHQIRVVDQEPAEVVRLDAARVSPLEKKGKISSAVLPMVPANEPEEQDEPKKAFDPELEWVEGTEDKEAETVPIGWFVLLVIGLLGVLGWVVFQTMTAEPDNGAAVEGGSGNSTVGDGRKSAEVEEAERLAAEVHFAEMEKVVSGFLKAGSVEEMKKWVRHPERVGPLMEAYHKTHDFNPLTFKSTDEYHIASLGNKPFIALKVQVEEQKGGVPILLEDSPDGLIVDWESFVCYQPMSPEEVVRKRPTTSLNLRAYIQRDNFHTFEFSDEKKYDCFKLSFRDSEVVLFGYVEKGTKLEREFLNLFPVEARKLRRPVIIQSRFLEGSKATRSMLIEELVSKMWAFPVNPEEGKQKN